MIEFLFNKDDIIKIVDKFIKKYEIEKSLAKAIYGNIKNTSYIPEDNDDNEEENKDNKKDNNKRPKSQNIIVKNEDTKKTDKRSWSFKEKENNNINKEGQKDRKIIKEEKKENNTKKEKKEDNIKGEQKEEKRENDGKEKNDKI